MYIIRHKVLIRILKLYSDALTRRFNYILIESCACVSLAFNIARYPLRISRNKRSVKSPRQAFHYYFPTKSIFLLKLWISLGPIPSIKIHSKHCLVIVSYDRSFRIPNECTLITYTVILVFHLRLLLNRDRISNEINLADKCYDLPISWLSNRIKI